VKSSNLTLGPVNQHHLVMEKYNLLVMIADVIEVSYFIRHKSGSILCGNVDLPSTLIRTMEVHEICEALFQYSNHRNRYGSLGDGKSFEKALYLIVRN
jgi:hypothetical protein